MNDLISISMVVLYSTKNKFKQILGQPLLKIIFISFLAILFWVGLYFLFLKALEFIDSFQYYSRQLIEALIYLLFFILLIMLIFSNAIISYISFFKTRETGFLLTSPIRYGTIYLYKLLDSLSFSSWAFLFLAFPLVFALGSFIKASADFYLLTFLLLALFIFIPAIVGSLIALLFATIFPRTHKQIGVFIFVITIFITLVVIFHIISLKAVFPVGLRLVWEILDKLSFSRQPLLPSFWISKGIISIMNKNYADFIFFAGLLVANILFLLSIAFIIVDAFYLKAWNSICSLTAKKRGEKVGLADILFVPFSLFVDKVGGVLIKKDMKCFLRDPVQWSQFLIFIGILAFYFSNIRLFGYEKREMFWRNLTAQMNVLAVSLTLVVFTSRFVFPQFSLEGKRLWFLGVSPVPLEKIVISKFILSFLYTLFLGGILILISSYMLEVPIPIVIIHLVSVFSVSLGLSGMAAGLGIVFPDFSEDNPSKIVSGFGGTLNLILSLVLVILCLVLQFIPSVFYFLGAFGELSFNFLATLCIIGVILISCAFCITSLRLGLTRLKTIEV